MAKKKEQTVSKEFGEFGQPCSVRTAIKALKEFPADAVVYGYDDRWAGGGAGIVIVSSADRNREQLGFVHADELDLN